MPIGRVLKVFFWIFIATALFGRSNTIPGDQFEIARAYTRDIEFNYVSWELNAIWIKLRQWALSSNVYLLDGEHKQIVLDYLDLMAEIQQGKTQLYDIYANPNITDPKNASVDLRTELEQMNNRRNEVEPLAESILQGQISLVVSELGLTIKGQPIPPVLYRTSPSPDLLVVSRRDIIQQVFDISIQPGLLIDQQVELEQNVDQTLNMSSLVVGIGGVGLYPTMVMETTDLNWLVNTVSHEWIHNFLTLRPLGVNYESTPELRTINETVASIGGNEIGIEVIARFYPELLPPPTPPAENSLLQESTSPLDPLSFNFNREMHETRITADKLLAEGKIDEAETYMETRRIFMRENGFNIRKLNQAYFAFYGAYADVPGGAAGEDPVGAAVRSLRTQSSTLAEFLNKISWMTSYQQLVAAIETQ